MASQAPSAAVELLESLLNTADHYNAVDDLDEVRGGVARLRAIGLLDAGAELDADGLRTVRAVRECLRGLAAANTHPGSPPAEVVEELTALLAPGHLQLELQAPDSLDVALRPAAADDTLAAVLGTIAAAIYDTVQAGAWTRFKACANEACRWAFYDGSRSRTGRWCDMRACGNLLKARAYRQRKAAAAG